MPTPIRGVETVPEQNPRVSAARLPDVPSDSSQRRVSAGGRAVPPPPPSLAIRRPGAPTEPELQAPPPIPPPIPSQHLTGTSRRNPHAQAGSPSRKVTFTCPGCRSTISFPAAQAGRTARCSFCLTRLTVPPALPAAASGTPVDHRPPDSNPEPVDGITAPAIPYRSATEPAARATSGGAKGTVSAGLVGYGSLKILGYLARKGVISTTVLTWLLVVFLVGAVLVGIGYWAAKRERT